MLVCSWNVNSINVRKDRYKAFVERVKPDVVCLQELKCVDDKFPVELAEGYHCEVFGQKTYNGVAILSRSPLTNVKRDFGFDDDNARFISANIDGVEIICVYCPNGQSVGSDKYQYKLEWFKALDQYISSNFKSSDKLILTGDFNIAPDDRDVYDPQKWGEDILCSPKERAAFEKLRKFGLEDTFRLHNQDNGVFSWWDFRTMGFPMNRGLRIDMVLATKPLQEVCERSWVERRERLGIKPSDHAPVLAEFTL